MKNQLGTLIGSGSVEFFDASTSYRLTVMDDDANDRWNNAVGSILAAFNARGPYGVCEKPSGAALIMVSVLAHEAMYGLLAHLGAAIRVLSMRQRSGGLKKRDVHLL